MFFQSKLDRAMEWLKNKNKKPDSQESNSENIEDIRLEKDDILALIISALLVFGPIFIILSLIIYFVFKIG
ncbi:MAG: hypothetical protein ACOXZT_01540 [Tissierellaceae bacterium]|jgi:hypothetical protein